MGLQGSAPRVQRRVGMVREYISEGRWRITGCQPDSQASKSGLVIMSLSSAKCYMCSQVVCSCHAMTLK